jgi:hypothetical protein
MSGRHLYTTEICNDESCPKPHVDLGHAVYDNSTLQPALLSLDAAFAAYQANTGYQHLMTDTLWGAIVNVLNAAKEQELIS